MRAAAVTLLLISGSVIADEAPNELEDIVLGCQRRDFDKAFVVRDQNPLLSGFGLPTTMPAIAPYGLSGRLDLYWGTTAVMQQRNDEALLVDAETREARLTLQGSFMDTGLSWQLQLPYRYTGGGNLDSFIDSWHDTFGLPDGARSALPRDQIAIAYTRAGTRQVNINSSASGLGDIQAAVGYELPTAATLTAWLTVKLPTGDADKLTGSGGTDVSLLLAGQRSLSDRWSVFGQAAATYLGEGDLLPDRQRSVVWSGMAGVAVQAWRGLSLKAQVDAHTAAYDSDLDFFSDAVVLTVGGDYRFDSGWRLDLGVSEDLAVEHSPDVVFVINVRQDW
ncbi:hypothetical protein GCM10011487_34920 [Steroidobacter agaridevorans]|uniref:DUF3187 domain-containing protein n=1 Tax=Steroidobacter agaridevorans TaxID=2695856 RepID=A0A829YFT5_9GAMM|nr:DUF3187 family protein [Steroidobacter agaridevorans]GFE81492.1 hypothetical protein GCM10011487_34920 [Steroidobacter agaridevorans]GFE90237.1 hypothetical protein GCM10011488_51910 [Steroidobacter agaridevorans]